MLLIGFIIRIYHDARSSECQIGQFNLKPVHFFVIFSVVVRRKEHRHCHCMHIRCKLSCSCFL